MTANAKMRLVPRYWDGEHAVTFVAVSDVPGFTHRVILDGVAVDWLARSHRPGAKAAEYYRDKHAPRAV